MQSMSTQATNPKRSIRRVMLPATAQMTPEAADIEDARKIRWGVSPSYFLNLGHLSGNRFVGYDEIYPRTLYRFDWVYPNGINESSDRMDEDKAEMPATVTTKRSPRTCAQDAEMEAGEKVLVVVSALTDREDAPEIWEAIYPVEVEAEIYAATQREKRGDLPDHLRQLYLSAGMKPPFTKDGHALQMFIDHLENDAPALIANAGFDEQTFAAAETALREITQGALNAYRHRYSRLSAAFGSRDARRNGGKGKDKLDSHDYECMAETGIRQPEDKPVEASQKMGQAIGDSIAARSAESEGHLAQAVAMLADSQRAMQEEAAADRKLMLEILRGRQESTS